MISLWEIATSVVLQPPRNDCEFWRLLRWLFYDLLAKSEDFRKIIAQRT